MLYFVAMPKEEMNLPIPLAERVNDRHVVIALILGFLTAAGILLLIYQANHAAELRVEAAEVWSDYQTRSLKATTEEDPNLRAQYAEEQEQVRQHAVELREKSKSAKAAMILAEYAAVLFLLGAAAAVVAVFGRSYMVYPGIVLGIIALALSIKTLL